MKIVETIRLRYLWSCDSDVFDLPWLRGYGLVKSLPVAYQESAALRQAASDLIAQGRNGILSNFDAFMAKWTGSMQRTVAGGQLHGDSSDMPLANQGNDTLDGGDGNDALINMRGSKNNMIKLTSHRKDFYCSAYRFTSENAEWRMAA